MSCCCEICSRGRRYQRKLRVLEGPRGGTSRLPFSDETRWRRHEWLLLAVGVLVTVWLVAVVVSVL